MINPFVEKLKTKYNINLNQQQMEAVSHIDGPALILAVPGAGKTTVMVARNALLVIHEKINPHNILTMTFSRKAAQDMKDRFDTIYGTDISQKVEFSTIHAFSYRVYNHFLKKYGNQKPLLLDSEETLEKSSIIISKIYQGLSGEYPSEDKVETLSSDIGYVENMLMTEEQAKKWCEENRYHFETYIAYKKYKKENNFIDFDDMLRETLNIFLEYPSELEIYRQRYKYINVDESQDTSKLQHKIIEILAKPRNNIFMVGDEDQSIYGFRAAFPQALLNFGHTYPKAKVYLMEQNYRSYKNITTAANTFIKQNKTRFDKNIISEKPEGDPIKHILLPTLNDQYKYIAENIKKNQEYSETAVLYRNNQSAVAIADELDRNEIPFISSDENLKFFKHWIVNDIRDFIAFSKDSTNFNMFENFYYKINAFITKKVMNEVKMSFVEGKNPFDILLQISEDKRMYFTVKRIKEAFELIKHCTNPSRAMEVIEYNLEYRDYLEFRQKGSQGADSISNVMNCLKAIADNERTIDSFIARLEQLEYIMKNSRKNRSKNISSVKLSTLHGSKGLEFDHVYIIDMIEKIFPSASVIKQYDDGDTAAMEEEVRLCYVGITRARKTLKLISAEKVNGVAVQTSRFVKQIINMEKSWDKSTPFPSEVRHRKFGVGKVVDLDYKNDLITIDFHTHGKKSLALKFALVQKLLFDENGEVIS